MCAILGSWSEKVSLVVTFEPRSKWRKLAVLNSEAYATLHHLFHEEKTRRDVSRKVSCATIHCRKLSCLVKLLYLLVLGLSLFRCCPSPPPFPHHRHWLLLNPFSCPLGAELQYWTYFPSLIFYFSFKELILCSICHWALQCPKQDYVTI